MKAQTNTLEELTALSLRAAELFLELKKTEAAILKAERKIRKGEVQELRRIADMPDRQKRFEALDRTIEEELKRLEKKLESPRFPWNQKEIFEELLSLLRKIFQKLIELQKALPQP